MCAAAEIHADNIVEALWMLLRCTFGLLILFALGFASREFLDYLDESQQRGRAKRVAMDTLIESQADEDVAALVAGTVAETLAEASSTVEAVAAAESLPISEGELVEPSLDRFAARVFDAESHAPLQGVNVECEGTTLASTDGEGRFLLDHPPRAAFALGLLAPGYGLSYVFVDEPLGTDTGEHHIALRRAATLVGRVLDRAGEACPGVRVVLTTPAPRLELTRLEDPVAQRRRIHPPDPRWEVISDAHGNARFDGLPAGVPLAVSLWEAGTDGVEVHSPRVSLAASDGEDTLPPGCLDAYAEPLVLAAAERHTAEWRLALAPTEVALTATPRSGRELERELPTAAREPPPATDHDVTNTRKVSFQQGPDAEFANEPVPAVRAATLAGRLTDDGGRPVEGLLVTVAREGASGSCTATTATDGTFQLGPLEGGEHDLVVYGGARFGTQSFGPFAPGTADLRLELDSGSVLGGRVLDPQTGAPLEAALSLHACTTLASRIATARSDASGRFTFLGLRPGSYDLVATTSDGRIAIASSLALGPASSQRNLELAPRAGAHLRLSSRSGQHIRRAVVLAGGHGVCALDMRKRVEECLLVPAGPIVVRLYEDARPIAERAVEIAAGGEASIRFD